jgi:hypothetical protein
MLRYDKKALIGRLQHLPNRLRVAFAAACAERQALKKPIPTVELRAWLDACMALLPEEDQGILDEHAVAQTIRAFLTSDAQEAAAAAGVAYSALDERVTEVLGIESIGKNEEAQILAHPLVQAEFERQQVDLLQLQKIAKNPTGEREGVAEIRRRAQADAKAFFGPEASRRPGN